MDQLVSFAFRKLDLLHLPEFREFNISLLHKYPPAPGRSRRFLAHDKK